MKRFLGFAGLCLLSYGDSFTPFLTVGKAESSLLTQQFPSELTAPSPSLPPQIELLRPGSEPRQLLRFKPALRKPQTVTVTINMTMTLSVAGQSAPPVPLPATVMKLQTTVTEVEESGDIHYEFAYLDVEVVPDGKTLPELVQVMRSGAQEMVGFKGEIIVDSRGRNKSGKFTIPEKISNNSKQFLQQLANSLEQLSSPFPEEAVGKGAQWRVTSASFLSGMAVKEIATYELKNLQDNQAILSVQIEQQAPPQVLNSQQLPQGGNLTLQSFNSQGRGQVEIRLDRLMPMRSVVSVNSQTEVKAGGSQNQPETTVGTKLRAEMTLESQ